MYNIYKNVTSAQDLIQLQPKKNIDKVLFWNK